MKKIGLLSDTHGFLDDKVFEHFKDCDEVWHAGDIGTVEVADRLAAFKPLRAVYGNIDSDKLRVMFKQHERWMCEGVDVWMTHIGGYPGKYAREVKPEIFMHPPKLFISGHSHILKVVNDKYMHLLHINPGAAGRQGWQTVPTIVLITLDKGAVTGCEVVELSK